MLHQSCGDGTNRPPDYSHTECLSGLILGWHAGMLFLASYTTPTHAVSLAAHCRVLIHLSFARKMRVRLHSMPQLQQRQLQVRLRR